MKKISMLTAITVIGLGFMYLSADDYGKQENVTMHTLQKMWTKKSDNVIETLYVNECAACHMAYQPEFLPKRSWKKMMKGLDNHFDVDATMDPTDHAILSRYLQENAADAKRIDRTFSKFARSISVRNTPLRITEIPKFKREHREIPQRLIKQKEVKSLANCVACHQGADKGSYDEHSISIPNYGRWDD